MPVDKCGFQSACDDVQPERRVVVYAGSERVPLPHAVETVGLATLARELADMA